jgi:hypothetical protein
MNPWGEVAGNVVAVTPAPLVLAAALFAWGPIAPAPPEAPAETAEPSTDQAPAPAPAEAPAPPSPPAAAPAPIQPAIIAKAPIVVRAAPAPLAAPARTSERGKLQSRWWFWAVAGGLFAAALVVTVVETRPGPQPYGGNTPPYTISFP